MVVDTFGPTVGVSGRQTFIQVKNLRSTDTYLVWFWTIGQCFGRFFGQSSGWFSERFSKQFSGQLPGWLSKVF